MRIGSDVFWKTFRFFVPQYGTQNDSYICHPEAQLKDPYNKVDFFSLSSLSGFSGFKLKRPEKYPPPVSSPLMGEDEGGGERSSHE
jgi:hypothetical protein